MNCECIHLLIVLSGDHNNIILFLLIIISAVMHVCRQTTTLPQPPYEHRHSLRPFHKTSTLCTPHQYTQHAPTHTSSPLPPTPLHTHTHTPPLHPQPHSTTPPPHKHSPLSPASERQSHWTR